MAIILKNSVFIHIPKTGGKWVSAVLESQHLVTEWYNVWGRHINLKDCIRTYGDIAKNKLVFTFIRNPVTWYQSRWTDHFMRQNPHFQKKCKTHTWYTRTAKLHNDTGLYTPTEMNDFNKWARRVITQHPGWLSSYYKFYLGAKYKRIENIGRKENLVNDLIDLLEKAGEKFNHTAVRDYPAINEGIEGLNRSWDYDLLKKTIKNEYDFMSRFGYSTDVNSYMNLIRGS